MINTMQFDAGQIPKNVGGGVAAHQMGEFRLMGVLKTSRETEN